MSGCSCGANAPVIVQCCGGSPTAPPVGPVGPVGPGPDNGSVPETPATQCARAIIRVESLRVENGGSEDFFSNLLDPADFLGEHQWRLTISVADQSRTWRDDRVRDGSNFNLGFSFEVDLPDPATTFTVRATGFEDQNIIDHALPVAERTHGAGDNFGIGASHQIQGTNGDFSYSVTYSISCATEAVQSVIRRAAVVDMLSGPLLEHSRREVGEDGSLAYFIHHMQTRGLRLRHVEREFLVFEGSTSVLQVARQTFRRLRTRDSEAKRKAK